MGSQIPELQSASATAPSKLAISSIIVVVDIVPTSPAPTTPNTKSISPVHVVVDTVPSTHASTTSSSEAIPAINNADAAPRTLAPITPIREAIPDIHDIGTISTTLTPFTPATEAISPNDVFGTLPTAWELVKHISDEVAATAEITKIESVTEAPSVHDDEVQNNEHSQIQTQNEIMNFSFLSETATARTTDIALQENHVATDRQDDASVPHNDHHVAEVDLEMAQDGGEPDYLAKYSAKDEDTCAVTAVACQMTEEDKMEMQAAFDEYFAELDARTIASTTEDADPLAVAALAGKVEDSDKMEIDVTMEQHPAASQDSSALSAMEQTTQHDLDTDMMVDVAHQAVQDHDPRVLSTTENAVSYELDTEMTNGIVHGAAERHNPSDPSTTEDVSPQVPELDDIMHDATEEDYSAAVSTSTPEIDMMDDAVHQAAEKHDAEMRDASRKSQGLSWHQELDTEMRDSPEKRHNVFARDELDIEMQDSPEKRPGVSARGIMPNSVANNTGNSIPPRPTASQSGQGRSAAQARVNSSIVQPVFVRYNPPVPATGSQNTQIHTVSQVSSDNPPIQPRLARNNATTPISPFLNVQAQSAVPVSNSNTPAQPLRSRSNALVSASRHQNDPTAQQSLLTRVSATPNQQRPSQTDGRTPNLQHSHVATLVQQARSSAQQGPSRTPAALDDHDEEPRDPWADQKVKVHKNKNRGRKKAEDEAKTLANIIARYSLPPPPKPQGIKRKLYIDHYGPAAYRERVDGKGGEYRSDPVY